MNAIVRSVQVLATRAAANDDSWFVGLQASEATGWYGPVSAEVGSYIKGTLAGAIVGESCTEHHALHEALCAVAARESTRTASWAVGAVDCAAWDLHGRLAEAPVANLLASDPEPSVPLYASWLGLDCSQPGAAATVARVAREGWRFTKWSLRTESASHDVRVEAARLTETTRTIAAALGGSAAFDAVFTWSVGLLNLVAEGINPADVVWLEDPLREYDHAAYRSFAKALPLAVGEDLLVHRDGQSILDLAPRALTLDVVGCGGLTRAVQLVRQAAVQRVPVYPHGRSFVPAIHLAAALPRAVPAVEYRLQWEPLRQQQYAQPWQPKSGAVVLSSAPGLGTGPRSC